jgi:hypothetical protein
MQGGPKQVGVKCSGGNIVCTNVPVGTYKRFYRNTVEISENSENHLKAIVGGRQVAGRVRFGGRGGKVAEKTQGEGKASKGGERVWHSALPSANATILPGTCGEERPLGGAWKSW